MTNQTKLIKIFLAIIFLLCLARVPYGYYQFVRFAGMVGFIVLAAEANNRNDSTFAVVWTCSALLINPFFKVALGRTLWNVVDVIWAVALLATLSAPQSKSR